MTKNTKLKKRQRAELGENEYVVTAYAERASGPGWANQPIWVIIRDRTTSQMREWCIQPEDQTEEMMTLYPFSEIAHRNMRAVATSYLGGGQ